MEAGMEYSVVWVLLERLTRQGRMRARLPYAAQSLKAQSEELADRLKFEWLSNAML